MRANLNTCHVWAEDGEQVADLRAGRPMEMPLTMQRRFDELRPLTGRVAGAGPVTEAMLDLSLDDVRARPGTKWSSIDGRLAAWVADMDFPVAPAIRDALVHAASTDVGYPHWPGIGRSPLPELFAERMAGALRVAARTRDGCTSWSTSCRASSRRSTTSRSPATASCCTCRRTTRSSPPSTQSGRRVVEVPAERAADRWMFDHDALDARLATEPARLLVLCHPHNPTGHVFTVDELTTHRRDRRPPRPRRDQRRDPRRAGPPAQRPRAVRLARCRRRGTHGDDLLVLEGVQPRRVALGDHARRVRRAAARPGGAAVALLRRAQPDGRRGDGGGVDCRRLVAASRRRTARRQPAPPRHACCRQHLPDVGYCVPEATYLAWLDCRALGFGDDPAEMFRRRGVELSPGPRFGPQGIGFARLNFATGPAVLTRIVEAMAEH